MLVLLATLLLSAPQSGATSRLYYHYATRYDDAFEEAQVRNVPVVILDFDGWKDDNQDKILRSDWFEDKELRAQLEAAVVILASQEQHEETVQEVDGDRRAVCGEFGYIPCGVHQRMLPEIFKDFAVEGAIASPLFLVVKPDRTLVARELHEERPSVLLPHLKAARQDLGIGLDRLTFRQLKEGVEQLRRALEIQEFRRACRALEALREIPGKTALHETLNGLVASFEELGQKALAEANERWGQGRHMESLVLYDRVESHFAALEVADDARKSLRDCLRTPEGKAQARAFKDHQAARTLFEKGSDAEEEGDKRTALRQFQLLVKKYPESLFADRVRPTIAILEEELKDR